MNRIPPWCRRIFFSEFISCQPSKTVNSTISTELLTEQWQAVLGSSNRGFAQLSNHSNLMLFDLFIYSIIYLFIRFIIYSIYLFITAQAFVIKVTSKNCYSWQIFLTSSKIYRVFLKLCRKNLKKWIPLNLYIISMPNSRYL